MFKLEIETGGAAFRNPITGEEDVYDEAAEIKRILIEVIRKLERGDTSGSIMDINGNKIGKWDR